jgi:hypothetical protein
MIALKRLVGCTGELLWADNVVATSTLLIKFAEETRRDLALITSYIIGVLGPAENLSEAGKP